ncbi:MAG: hypothetical protein LBH64_05370, partial [Coriobacteriales bacterium]|nr:hypothetical protein [Coriobacteriales bacterium]
MRTYAQTIAQLNSLTPEAQWLVFGDYLDELYHADSPDSQGDLFAAEPDWGALDERTAAFYAAAAHQLANTLGAKVPKWDMNPEYFLVVPYFSLDDLVPVRLVLIAESPKQFRQRNIFV